MKERRFDPVPYLSFDARWSVSFWAALTWLMATVSLQAQNPTPPAMSPLAGTTPSINEPGAPEGSYRLSSIEHLNYANGHLNISIPLVDIPGRGGAKETLVLPIESHWWVMSQPYRYGNNQSSVGFSYLPYNTPWNSDEPTFWGGILLLRNGGDFCYVLSGSPPDAWQNTLTRLTFIAPDGTEHELRDVNTDGQKQGIITGQTSLTTTFNRGTVFQAYDGSDAVFTSTSPIMDEPRENCGGADPMPSPNGNGTLQLRDGTKYTITYGYVTQVEDRNGNLLALPSPATGTYPLQINDALGRTTSINAPGNTQTVTYPGYNGQLETVTITYNSLGNLTNGVQTQTYGALFPLIDTANNCQPNSSGCEGGTDNSTPYDPPGMVQSVQYPNGQSYSFVYDVYGNVARVTLPTGGWYKYTYNTDVYQYSTGGGWNLPSLPTFVIESSLTEKDVYQSDGTEIEIIQYSSPTGYSGDYAGHVVYKDGSGNLLGIEDHLDWGVNTNPPLDATAYPNWYEGKEQQTNFTDKDGATLLRTEAFTWTQQACTACWWLNPNYNTGTTPEYNPQITEKAVTMGSQTSMDCYTYDQYSNQTEDDEYDYGSTSSPTCAPLAGNGPLIRKSLKTYQYYNNVPPGAYILDMLTEQQVLDTTNAIVADTKYTFDDPAYPPQAALGITQHDSSYSTSYLTRGNATEVTQILNDPVNNIQNKSLTSYYTYDIAGNIVTSLDPRGVQHNYGYSDPGNTFALPTSVKSYTALNGTGTALTASAVYDYNVAKPISTTDVNSNPTSYQYNDGLGRLTHITRPDTGTTTITYNDTPGSVSVETDSDQITGDDNLKSVVFYDGLGREWERSKMAGLQNIMVCKQYDGRNRLQSVSNPAYSNATFPGSDTSICGVTGSSTSYIYDGMNRELTETAPDASPTQHKYQTDSTSHTYQTLEIDPASRNRLNYVDAAGRLKEVDENVKTWQNGSYGLSGPTYQTTYGYDVLDNLTSVTQSPESRNFTYDTLKRLVKAVNPESGAITCAYDASNNLSKRTDANGTALTLSAYDGMNRITGKSYALGTNVAPTPSVSYAYGDTMTACNLKGRLMQVTASTTPANLTYNYTCYNWAGQPTASNQVTGEQTHGMSYGYDLARELTSFTLPSGRQQTIAYDTGGRATGVSGTYGTASTAYAGSLVYFPNGAIDNLKLSPNLLIQQQCQNSRLQVTNVRLARAGVGTTGSCVNGGSGTAGDWLNLGFGFATGGTNNGNIISSAIATSQPLSLTQTFTYDAYNRIATAVEAGSPGWTRNYNYDAYGNGWVSYNSGLTLSPFTATGTTTSSSNFASNNQLSIANSAYDLAGNQTAIGGYTFTYDGENRQATAKLNGVTTTYTYDGEGRRVQKATSGGATTVYVYDAGGQLAAEYSSSPPTQSATLYLTDDPLGSTRLVSNAAGSPVGYDDYLPFGEEIPSGTDGRGSLYYATDGVTQKFTGKERDAELAGSAMQGLDFFLTRYSSGAQGRFTSPDKFPWWSYQHAEKDEDKETFKDFMANPQNWNMYAYVLNNPLNHTDPTGMLGCQVGDQKYASCTITVVYDRKTSEGTLTVTGQNKGDKKATVLLTASVVVGGDGHITPTGDYHAGKWTKDYTTQTYGWKANTKWSESPLGLNAFGPYQLHIKELEDRGIWIHGTMGPGWSGTTKVSGIAVSETSHGCVRMCNRDDIQLFKMMPNPVGNPIKISTNPNDFPGH